MPSTKDHSFTRFYCGFCEKRFEQKYKGQLYCNPKHRSYQSSLNWLTKKKREAMKDG